MSSCVSDWAHKQQLRRGTGAVCLDRVWLPDLCRLLSVLHCIHESTSLLVRNLLGAGEDVLERHIAAVPILGGAVVLLKLSAV